jgi:hypothetical protein
MPVAAPEVLQQVGSDEAPRPSYLLTRKNAFTCEREDGLGTHAQKTRRLVGRQYLCIFLHLPATPGVVLDLTLLGGCDSDGEARPDVDLSPDTAGTGS